MKAETRAAKLAALLGISEVVEKHVEKKNNRNKFVEVPEDKIQDFRAAQGLIYFLQAPELFKMRLCSWRECQQPFAVSRQFVSVCSYTCLKDSLADIGIDWNRDGTSDREKIEMTIDGIWEGQEPLWIREPMLTRLQERLSLLSTEQSTKSSLVPQ